MEALVHFHPPSALQTPNLPHAAQCGYYDCGIHGANESGPVRGRMDLRTGTAMILCDARWRALAMWDKTQRTTVTSGYRCPTLRGDSQRFTLAANLPRRV